MTLFQRAHVPVAPPSNEVPSSSTCAYARTTFVHFTALDGFSSDGPAFTAPAGAHRCHRDTAVRSHCRLKGRGNHLLRKLGTRNLLHNDDWCLLLLLQAATINAETANENDHHDRQNDSNDEGSADESTGILQILAPFNKRARRTLASKARRGGDWTLDVAQVRGAILQVVKAFTDATSDIHIKVTPRCVLHGLDEVKWHGAGSGSAGLLPTVDVVPYAHIA